MHVDKIGQKEDTGELIEAYKLMTNNKLYHFRDFPSSPAKVDYKDTDTNLQGMGRLHQTKIFSRM